MYCINVVFQHNVIKYVYANRNFLSFKFKHSTQHAHKTSHNNIFAFFAYPEDFHTKSSNWNFCGALKTTVCFSHEV